MEESQTIPLDGIDQNPIFNVQGVGYYRVNYDETMWLKIADQLIVEKDRFPALSRAVIICDVAALARSGHVSQDVAEAVLSFRDIETDFAPLLAFKECVDEADAIDQEQKNIAN